MVVTTTGTSSRTYASAAVLWRRLIRLTIACLAVGAVLLLAQPQPASGEVHQRPAPGLGLEQRPMDESLRGRNSETEDELLDYHDHYHDHSHDADHDFEGERHVHWEL